MTTQYLVALIRTLNSPGALSDITRDDNAVDFVGMLPDGRGVITSIDAIVDAAIAGIGGAVVPTSRQILTSGGIEGGGDLTADRTLSLTAGVMTSLGLADTAVQPARQIIAGTGLQGGGSFAADRTISLNSATLASLGKADTALQPALIGAANGIAPLGSDAKINASYLPAVAISESFVVASQAAMLALTAQVGDVAIRTDESNAAYLLSQTPASTLANWVPINQATGAVTSVAGKTGNVTLVIGDVTGLQSALDSKQNALTYTPVDRAGDTMSGDLTVDSAVPSVRLTGPAGSARRFKIDTDGARRWEFGANGAPELGSNTGTDWVLNRHDDAGAFLSTVLSILRSTGAISVGGALSVGTTLTVTGDISHTGNFSMTKANPIMQMRRGAAESENILLRFQGTDGNVDWMLGEAGTSNRFSIWRRDASGGAVDQPLSIDYATGLLNVPNGFDTDIVVTRGFPQIRLNKTTQAQTSSVAGQLNGLNQWNLVLGTGDAAGDLVANAYDDAGAFIATRMTLNRLTGWARFDGDVTIMKNFPELRMITGSNRGWRLTGGSTGTTLGELTVQGSTDNYGSSFIDGLVVATNGQVRTPSGFKWMRTIDITGQDLNSLVDAGSYSGQTLTNAPMTGGGYWYVRVENHNSQYQTQEASLLTVNRSLCTLRRIRNNGTWSRWEPISGFVTPAHFGATGANTPSGLNSIDDTASVQAWINSDLPKWVDRWYRLVTSQVFRDLAAGDIQGFQIFGNGAMSGFRLDSQASLLFYGGNADNPTGPTSDQVTLRDFQIMQNSYGAAESLAVAFADNDSGSSMPTLDMQNVHIIAATTAAGNSGKQISIYNVRNGSFRNVSGFGRYGTYNGTFLECSGGANSASVELTFHGCRAAHFQKGFVIGPSGGGVANDDMQGIMFEACTAIAVDRGWEADGGAEGFGEWLGLSKCHSYFREVGLIGTNFGNVRADQNYFLGHGALTTCQGIALSGSSIESWNSISYNRIRLDAATGANRYGLNLAATLTGTAADNKVSNATNAYGFVAGSFTQRNNV